MARRSPRSGVLRTCGRDAPETGRLQAADWKQRGAVDVADRSRGRRTGRLPPPPVRGPAYGNGRARDAVHAAPEAGVRTAWTAASGRGRRPALRAPRPARRAGGGCGAAAAGRGGLPDGTGRGGAGEGVVRDGACGRAPDVGAGPASGPNSESHRAGSDIQRPGTGGCKHAPVNIDTRKSTASSAAAPDTHSPHPRAIRPPARVPPPAHPLGDTRRHPRSPSHTGVHAHLPAPNHCNGARAGPVTLTRSLGTAAANLGGSY
ncbi:hypothetical protein RKD29_007697 [Streptomyces tendae]